MEHLKKIKSAMSGTAAAAISQIRKDLKSEIGEEELRAMGKGEEEHEEGGEEHEQE